MIRNFEVSVDGTLLRISGKETLENFARNVLQAFQHAAPQWRDGLALRVGWAAYQLKETDFGYQIWAPTRDTGVDIEFGPDASRALWVSTWQEATVARAGVEREPVLFDQRIAYEKRALFAPDISIGRFADRDNHDSGWFLGLTGASEPAAFEDLASIDTYQLTTIRPAAMKLLALPSGTVASLSGETVNAVLDAQGNALIEGPY